jgi:membrane fusion protein (multidrug efflux system)
VLEEAQIDLSYTKVMAPEDGLAGRTEVYAGTLVGRGSSTLLTRISRIDPIHVRFSFPERDYLAYSRKRAGAANAGTESTTLFELTMADGTTLPSPGKLVFVDRNVDAQTGTIMGEAAFANPGDLLRPGQYARVRATIEQRAGALLVPQRAVKETQGIFSVMVVGPGDETEERIVTTGERIGPLWLIESGLKGGERVVVEGLQKVRPKMKVHAQEVPAEEKESPPSAPAPTTKPGESK